MPDSSTAADSPFAGSIRPKRLYILITMQQKFIFPNNHSIHTLQPINIPSDYRFSFCLANLFKVNHNYRSVNPPFYQEGLNLLSNFQKRKGGWSWQKVYIWRKSLYTKIFLMFLNVVVFGWHYSQWILGCTFPISDASLSCQIGACILTSVGNFNYNIL